MVSTQYDTKVKGWMFNAGGEYRSDAFDKLLADNRITTYQSAPHIPQQNDCTECFMQTIMDKSESMCLQACILEFHWEFSWAHTIHIYNRTSLWCHDWQTSYKNLLQFFFLPFLLLMDLSFLLLYMDITSYSHPCDSFQLILSLTCYDLDAIPLLGSSLLELCLMSPLTHL